MEGSHLPAQKPLAALFAPLRLTGGLEFKNRIAMLPMTRVRAESDGTPNALMAEYYAQRAGAGLILTDATAVSPVGRCFFNAPAMYTTEHAIGWRQVVDAVHRKGSKIFLQIYHVGRANNLQHLGRPLQPVSASSVRIPRDSRKITINIPRTTPYDLPRPLETEEVPLIADEFARATRLAAFAGFDGVQIHADSGYLIHQFLSTNVNQRDDRYGGSCQNRARFALEVLEKVVAVKGPEFVSIKLTPGFQVHEIEEDDIDEKYSYIVSELNKYPGLAFLHLYFGDLATSGVYKMLRDAFKGPILAEGSLKAVEYAEMIDAGIADFTGFARAFVSNPDLVDRLANGWPIATPDMNSIYTAGPEGYTDYPEWQQGGPAPAAAKVHDDADKLLLDINI